MCDEIDASNYGVKGDGGDYTSELQTAISAAVSANMALCLPAGTIGTTGITGETNLKIRGAGVGLTTLQLLSTTTNNYLLSFVECSNIVVSDLTFLGVPSGTIGTDLITLDKCFNYTLINLRISGATVESGEYGDGIYIVSTLTGGSSNQAQNGTGLIENVYVENCGQNGVHVVKDWNISIATVTSLANGVHGIFVDNTVSPFQADKTNNIRITNCLSLTNGQSGILVTGFDIGSVTVGSNTYQLYSPTPPQAQQIVISNNVSNDNGYYGIVFQGANGSVTSNVTRQNGGATPTYAGILFNAYASVCSNNTCENNGYYGIDAGGAYNCVISGNICQYNGQNGSANNGGVGINVGASVFLTVSQNSIILASDQSSSAFGINANGLDGDGRTYFNQRGQYLNIVDNTVEMGTGNTAFGAGISVSLGFQYVKVRGNIVFAAVSPAVAFRLEIPLLLQSDNVDTSSLAGNSVTYAVTAAATVIVPDVGERFFVEGSTNITDLSTYSQNNWAGKFRDVIMTNNGSGYTPGTTPSVTISGGGGSGATGTAAISAQGEVIGVIVTNTGSGYTSAPTVTFPAPSSGTTATAVAVVGCANQDSRSIELFFAGSQTVTAGNKLNLSATSIATRSNLTLLALRGAYGEWYQQYLSQLVV